MTFITAVILTYNEEVHISRCIRSLVGHVSHIVIVDSGSTDKTLLQCELHRKAIDMTIVYKEWLSYGPQFNFGIDCAPNNTDWILRIDADEVLIFEDRQSLEDIITCEVSANVGFRFKRTICFNGTELKFSTATWPVRLFKKGYGRCEEKRMDEHIMVKGSSKKLEARIVDNNLKSIDWFVQKHVSYANREVLDYFFVYKDSVYGKVNLSSDNTKSLIYYKTPIGIRPVLYFLFVYIGRCGFLSGIDGLVYHLIQSLLYRLYVDYKIRWVEKLREQLGVAKALEIVAGYEGIQ